MLLHGQNSGARSCLLKASWQSLGQRNMAAQDSLILSHLLLLRSLHVLVFQTVDRTTDSELACWATPSLLLVPKSRSVTSCLVFFQVKIVGARVTQSLLQVRTWATLVVVRFLTVMSGSLMVKRSGHLLVISQTIFSFLHVPLLMK